MGLLPQWTEKADKRGLDPLGIQNSGVLLYQALLPGISNVTLRMRYYAYYCWISEAYARRGASSDFEAWRSWVRRAEALYALVAARAGETGVGGVEWANRRLATGKKTIDFAAAASTDASQERYLRQSLGVFGGAYYSQMVEIGLFTQNKHGIQIATRELGKRAASLFAEAIGTAAEKLLLKKIKDASVSIRELDSLTVIAPSKIPKKSDEREFYETLLFGGNADPNASDASRAATLRLILDTAEAIEELPGPEDVRWHLFDAPEKPLPAPLEGQRLNWEVYQCQDLVQVASAALLAWAISLMNGHDGGISFPDLRAEIITHLEARNDNRFARSWSDLRLADGIPKFDFRGAWGTITGRAGSPGDKAVLAIELMAALDYRVLHRADLAEGIDHELPRRGSAHSLRTELAWLRLREDRSVIELIAEYIMERVVRRHGWVAMQKLRRQQDYTFLFETHDGRLVFLKGYQPVATTPRLKPAIDFLCDIHLLDDDGLTVGGRRVLESAT